MTRHPSGRPIRKEHKKAKNDMCGAAHAWPFGGFLTPRLQRKESTQAIGFTAVLPGTENWAEETGVIK
jgi:hypothetical protein